MSKIINDIRGFLQKIRIEFFVLGSLITFIIAFSTNYYIVRLGNAKGGINIFENIYGAKIGWLFFIIILGGYLTTLFLCSYDDEYSKRSKLTFLGTLAFTLVLFISLVIWVVADKDYGIFKEKIAGIVRSGRFGFAFYWFFIHLFISSVVVLLYNSYQGSGERSAYSWILRLLNDGKPLGKNINNKYKELKKAKEMLDLGIFTEAEFLREKQEILEKYKQ